MHYVCVPNYELMKELLVMTAIIYYTTRMPQINQHPTNKSVCGVLENKLLYGKVPDPCPAKRWSASETTPVQNPPTLIKCHFYPMITEHVILGIKKKPESRMEIIYMYIVYMYKKNVLFKNKQCSPPPPPKKKK